MDTSAELNFFDALSDSFDKTAAQPSPGMRPPVQPQAPAMAAPGMKPPKMAPPPGQRKTAALGEPERPSAPKFLGEGSATPFSPPKSQRAKPPSMLKTKLAQESLPRGSSFAGPEAEQFARGQVKNNPLFAHGVLPLPGWYGKRLESQDPADAPRAQQARAARRPTQSIPLAAPASAPSAPPRQPSSRMASNTLQKKGAAMAILKLAEGEEMAAPEAGAGEAAPDFGGGAGVGHKARSLILRALKGGAGKAALYGGAGAAGVGVGHAMHRNATESR